MNFRWRFLWPLALTCVCLIGLCIFTAVAIFRKQATFAEMLRERIASRQAAAEFKRCLLDLNALLADRVEGMDALHDRAILLLANIEKYADQPEEIRLWKELHGKLSHYLEHWKNVPKLEGRAHEDALLEASVMVEWLLKTCEELLNFDVGRLQEIADHHNDALRKFAGGIAAVSGLGGFAGIMLGFGLARGLNRSIRRLQIQVRDAAGRLGDKASSIVVTGEGAFSGLHEQMDDLSARIETIVGRLRQRDREVLRSEQMAAVGQLATGVAHEIRNPLTSIKMLVQTGLEEDGVPLGLEDLRVIEQEIRRLESSLNTFLDFARPTTPQCRSVDLIRLVSSVLDLIRGRAEKQQVAIVLCVPVEQASLIIDGEQIRQVLVNLMLNALDAMPLGGTLTIDLDILAEEAIIRVVDTGDGIHRDLMSRLFQPFVSGKETGLGMGLVISKRIVEGHGGSLTAVNGAARGAVFTISLPTAPPLSGKN